MAGFRTVALGAALVAATAGAGIAQATTQGTRPDSVKAGEWRKGQPGKHGEMGPEMRRGAEGRMHGQRGGQRGRGFGPGAQGRMGAPGMEFMRELNLTATQRTQVKAIHEKYQPQMQAIHERARTEFAATRDARQRGDTAGVKAALQRSRQNIEAQTGTLHEQMFSEVRTVLTAEQRAKVDAQIAERIKRLDESKARLERMRR